MLLLVIGIAVLAATIVAFIAMLPREGRLHRFANTQWEPYVGVAFTAAVALGLTMSLSGVLSLLG
jgi:hypothetical protein